MLRFLRNDITKGQPGDSDQETALVRQQASTLMSSDVSVGANNLEFSYFIVRKFVSYKFW
jgi:hypothetical protein